MSAHVAAARIGLVLGAGGIVGHAFHVGVLAALEEATGWDPRSAEIVVGTSAGSRVASLLRAGVPARDLFARTVGEPPSAEGARVLERLGPARRPPLPRPSSRPGMPALPLRLLLRSTLRPGGVRPGVLLAAMLPPGTVSSDLTALGMREIFADRWPDRPLWICAVRLEDGVLVAFGREGSPATDVASAVAASCAIPGYFEPVEIGGRVYVDGGAHSPTNLDLLARSRLDLVIVSSPMSLRLEDVRPSLDLPLRLICHRRLRIETREVRNAGTAVVAFEPGAAERSAMGLDALDPGRREAVARRARDSALLTLASRATRDRLAALGT